MMGFDAFIDFLLTFFPLKQMERMKNTVSTHTVDSKKDLDNIQDAFRELLPWLGANFHYYRLLVPSVIAIMDKRQMDGLCCMFTNAYQELQHQVPTHEFYKEGYVPNGSVKGGKNYFHDIGKPVLSAIMSKGDVRLSDVVMPSGLNYTQEELNLVLGDVVIIVQECMKMKMDCNVYEGSLMMLPLARALSIELNCRHVFYHLMGLFLEHVAMYIDKQVARDIIEEVLICGEKDNQEHEAYLVACRLYLVCNNLAGALIFYNIHLQYMSKIVEVSNYLWFKSIWQFSKLARGIRFAHEKFFDELEYYLTQAGVGQNHIIEFQHSKYVLLLSCRTPGLVTKVIDTLNKNKDYLQNDGIHSAKPWWILLVQMQIAYSKEETEVLNSWLQMFDAMIPDKEILGKHYNYVMGVNLTDTFKEELALLMNTRSEDDYVKDCEFAMSVAKKMITAAGKINRISDYLMAMLVRADFGFVFNNKPAPAEELRQLKWSHVAASEVALIHENCDKFEQALAHDVYDEIIWLGEGEDAIYQMSKDKTSYAIARLNGWNLRALKEYVNERTTHNTFSRCKRDSRTGEIRDLDPSEHQEKYNEELLRCIDFPVYLLNSASRVLFVKDSTISAFPHHLIVESEQRKFVGELKPSANILSSEFLMMENFADNLPIGFTKSFWSPIDSERGKEDVALQTVFSYIEDALNKYAFRIERGLYPTYPLCSDINIVCAHGTSAIKEEPRFAINGGVIEHLNDLKQIIGKGRLLVLMVCHSGEMGSSRYDSSVHSLIKKFIRAEYSSIVAPMWALPIEIFDIWMPVFLESLHRGDYVIDALFNANMSVKRAYADPSAWACMHLFGNPYLRQEYNN